MSRSDASGQRRTQDVLKGGGELKFSYIVTSTGCEKSTLRKLFTMLQASSVLSQSKNIYNTFCKVANHIPNLTEETIKT